MRAKGEKELSPDWKYRRRQSSKLIAGLSTPRITHQIIYRGKVVQRSRGTDELEGARCKKIVDQCNRDGVKHEPVLIGADIPSAATRCEQLSKAAEARAEKNLKAIEKWAESEGVGIYKVPEGYRCHHPESGKSVIDLTRIEAATRLCNSVKKLKRWEGYYE